MADHTSYDENRSMLKKCFLVALDSLKKLKINKDEDDDDDDTSV